MAVMDYMERFFGRLFSWCERNLLLVTVFFFALTAAIRCGFAFTAWRFFGFPYQRYDPYMYVVKGMEIVAGDWSPVRTHGLGWPAVLGGIFRIWHGSSAFENLVIASIVAALLSALSLLPFLYIGKKIDAHPHAYLLSLVLFSSSFLLTLPENDSIAMADPLFVLLFLISLCFLYGSRRRQPLLAMGGAVAGLAYFVKPVGLFIVPVIVLSYWLWTEDKWRAARGIVLFICVFAAVSAPFLLARHAVFGSFFSYGENSKYFSDTYTDAWGEAVSPVSFITYLATHGMGDYIDKFVIGGFLFVFGMFLSAMTPYFFGFLHYSSREAGVFNDRLYPLWIACVVWIVGLTPVFHIYGNPRHLLPLIPLCILMGAVGLRHLAGGMHRPAIAYAGIIVFSFIFLIVPFSITVFFSKEKHVIMRDGAIWARELAPLLAGNVAIGNGSDILMMQYPDSRVGGRGMLDMYAPQSHVAVRYPGKFDRVEDFRAWLKSADIAYVVFDDVVKESFAFAPDKYLSIYTGVDFPPYLVPFYSNYEGNSQWKVRVFRVNRQLL